MTGKIYVGVNGVAKKPKNIYVGVNGVARKVKAAYVGVNGVARKVWPISNIPDDKYQELEWISPFKFTSDIKRAIQPRIKMTISHIERSLSSAMLNLIDGFSYATSTESGTGLYRLNMSFSSEKDKGQFIFTYRRNASDVTELSSNDTEGILSEAVYNIDFLNNKSFYIYCDQGYYSISSHNLIGSTTTVDTKSSDENLYFFNTLRPTVTCRVYSITMFNGDNKISDLIPCYRKSDSIIGFYDIVDRIFYGSGVSKDSDDAVIGSEI